MRRQQQRCIQHRCKIRCKIVYRLQTRIERGDAEINDLALVLFLHLRLRQFLQQAPTFRERGAINKILRSSLGVLVTNEDNRRCGFEPTQTVEAAKALAQGIQTRGFRHQRVKTEIGTYLDALGADQHHRPFGPVRFAGFEHRFPPGDELVTLEGAQPAREQHNVNFTTALLA